MIEFSARDFSAFLREHTLPLRRELETLRVSHNDAQAENKRLKVSLQTAELALLEKVEAETDRLQEQLRNSESERVGLREHIKDLEATRAQLCSVIDGQKATIARLRNVIEDQKQHMVDPDGVQVGGPIDLEGGELLVLDELCGESEFVAPQTGFEAELAGVAYIIRNHRVVWRRPDAVEEG